MSFIGFNPDEIIFSTTHFVFFRPTDENDSDGNGQRDQNWKWKIISNAVKMHSYTSSSLNLKALNRLLNVYAWWFLELELEVWNLNYTF